MTCQEQALAQQAVGRALTVAGLFAGIGGFEAGFAAAGHETRLLCEQDTAARAVLSARFSDVPLHSDVCTLERLPDIDVLTCGFPCQDLSQAGRTAGIAGAQSGLIGHLFRLLSTAARPPSWVVIENVPFLLHLDSGRAMRLLTHAFELLGYRWAYRIVDAQGFGLPQRRRRLIMLASRDEDPCQALFGCEAGALPTPPLNADAFPCGFYWTEGRTGLGWAVNALPPLKGGSGLGLPSLPAVRMPRPLKGPRFVTPGTRDAEAVQGFSRDWTAPASDFERARLRMIGNAIPVPIARWIAGRLTTDCGASWVSTPVKGGRWPSAAWGEAGHAPMEVASSQRPVNIEDANLIDYLIEPAPLTPRAARGFLKRAALGTLRFPDALLEDLRMHADSLSLPVKGAA